MSKTSSDEILVKNSKDEYDIGMKLKYEVRINLVIGFP